MLKLEDINKEIELLEQAEKPSCTVCEQLAWLYIIRDTMSKRIEPQSTATTKVEDGIKLYGNTEFLQAISGKNEADVWTIIDELMSLLKSVNARVYDGVLGKIKAQKTHNY